MPAVQSRRPPPMTLLGRGLKRARPVGAFAGAFALVALASLLVFAVPASAESLPTRLSDEVTLSRWAYVNDRAKVLVLPQADARSITRLRYVSENGQPDIYLALRSHVDEQGTTWIQVRVPMYPNGGKGWVRREALGPFLVVRGYLRVNRKTLRATLYRNGRKIFSAPIAVGAPGHRTPAGRFWAREKFNLPSSHPLGPVNIGIGAYTKRPWRGTRLVGLCGTNRPGTVPGRVTPGSIRFKNRDLLHLSRLMPLGTPIRVL